MPSLDRLERSMDGQRIEAGAPARDRRLCIAVTEETQPIPKQPARVASIGLA
jgi:hypothetical protein